MGYRLELAVGLYDGEVVVGIRVVGIAVGFREGFTEGLYDVGFAVVGDGVCLVVGLVVGIRVVGITVGFTVGFVDCL